MLLDLPPPKKNKNQIESPLNGYKLSFMFSFARCPNPLVFVEFRWSGDTSMLGKWLITPAPNNWAGRKYIVSIDYVRDLRLRLIMYWSWLLFLFSFAFHFFSSPFISFAWIRYYQDYKGLVMQNPSRQKTTPWATFWWFSRVVNIAFMPNWLKSSKFSRLIYTKCKYNIIYRYIIYN